MSNICNEVIIEIEIEKIDLELTAGQVTMFRGQDGKDGQDGRTPVKGEDYYTNEDKDELLNELQESVVVPTKLSELTNDENFIKNTVANLTNYYLKGETYTKTEVNGLISAIPQFAILIVEELPTENISAKTIYLVAKSSQQGNDYFDEYIYISDKWELLGTTQIDLSNYYTKSAIDLLLANKVDKVPGKGLSENDYTTTDKERLAQTSGTNTGDQDLSALQSKVDNSLETESKQIVGAINEIRGSIVSANESLTEILGV